MPYTSPESNEIEFSVGDYSSPDPENTNFIVDTDDEDVASESGSVTGSASTAVDATTVSEEEVSITSDVDEELLEAVDNAQAETAVLDAVGVAVVASDVSATADDSISTQGSFVDPALVDSGTVASEPGITGTGLFDSPATTKATTSPTTTTTSVFESTVSGTATDHASLTGSSPATLLDAGSGSLEPAITGTYIEYSVPTETTQETTESPTLTANTTVTSAHTSLGTEDGDLIGTHTSSILDGSTGTEVGSLTNTSTVATTPIARTSDALSITGDSIVATQLTGSVSTTSSVVVNSLLDLTDIGEAGETATVTGNSVLSELPVQDEITEALSTTGSGQLSATLVGDATESSVLTSTSTLPTIGSTGTAQSIAVLETEEGVLYINPNTPEAEAVHTWNLLDPSDEFNGEADDITVDYNSGSQFDGLTEEDVTVYMDRDGDGTTDEIPVNSGDYSGSSATFDLDGRYNTSVEGEVEVIIDGVTNRDIGDYNATFTLDGDDTHSIQEDYKITVPLITASDTGIAEPTPSLTATTTVVQLDDLGIGDGGATVTATFPTSPVGTSTTAHAVSELTASSIVQIETDDHVVLKLSPVIGDGAFDSSSTGDAIGSAELTADGSFDTTALGSAFDGGVITSTGTITTTPGTGVAAPSPAITGVVSTSTPTANAAGGESITTIGAGTIQQTDTALASTAPSVSSTSILEPLADSTTATSVGATTAGSFFQATTTASGATGTISITSTTGPTLLEAADAAQAETAILDATGNAIVASDTSTSSVEAVLTTGVVPLEEALIDHGVADTAPSTIDSTSSVDSTYQALADETNTVTATSHVVGTDTGLGATKPTIQSSAVLPTVGTTGISTEVSSATYESAISAVGIAIAQSSTDDITATTEVVPLDDLGLAVDSPATTAVVTIVPLDATTTALSAPEVTAIARVNIGDEESLTLAITPIVRSMGFSSDSTASATEDAGVQYSSLTEQTDVTTSTEATTVDSTSTVKTTGTGRAFDATSIFGTTGPLLLEAADAAQAETAVIDSIGLSTFTIASTSTSETAGTVIGSLIEDALTAESIADVSTGDILQTGTTTTVDHGFSAEGLRTQGALQVAEDDHGLATDKPEITEPSSLVAPDHSRAYSEPEITSTVTTDIRQTLLEIRETPSLFVDTNVTSVGYALASTSTTTTLTSASVTLLADALARSSVTTDATATTNAQDTGSAQSTPTVVGGIDTVGVGSTEAFESATKTADSLFVLNEIIPGITHPSESGSVTGSIQFAIEPDTGFAGDDSTMVGGSFVDTDDKGVADERLGADPLIASALELALPTTIAQVATTPTTGEFDPRVGDEATALASVPTIDAPTAVSLLAKSLALEAESIQTQTSVTTTHSVGTTEALEATFPSLFRTNGHATTFSSTDGLAFSATINVDPESFARPSPGVEQSVTVSPADTTTNATEVLEPTGTLDASATGYGSALDTASLTFEGTATFASRILGLLYAINLSETSPLPRTVSQRQSPASVVIDALPVGTHEREVTVIAPSRMPDVDFDLTEGDTSPEIIAQLIEDGKPLEEAKLEDVTIKFKMKHIATGHIIEGLATVEDLEEAEVAYDWSDGDTDDAGVYEAVFELDHDDPGSLTDFEKDATFPPDVPLRVKVNESI